MFGLVSPDSCWQEASRNDRSCWCPLRDINGTTKTYKIAIVIPVALLIKSLSWLTGASKFLTIYILYNITILYYINIFFVIDVYIYIYICVCVTHRTIKSTKWNLRTSWMSRRATWMMGDFTMRKLRMMYKTSWRLNHSIPKRKTVKPYIKGL